MTGARNQLDLILEHMLQVKEGSVLHCDREAKSDTKQQDLVLRKARIKDRIKNESSQSLLK